MTGQKLHIAAVFETTDMARAAQAALIAAGVPAAEILVLDRGNPDPVARRPGQLWGALRERMLPKHHAHHYAEAVTRGHPLLVADIDEAQQAQAVAALQSLHPIDLEARAEAWQQEGWTGTHAGEAEYEAEEIDGTDKELDEHLMAGDYGMVGAPVHGTRSDSDIRRGTVRLYRIG